MLIDVDFLKGDVFIRGLEVHVLWSSSSTSGNLAWGNNWTMGQKNKDNDIFLSDVYSSKNWKHLTFPSVKKNIKLYFFYLLNTL